MIVAYHLEDDPAYINTFKSEVKPLADAAKAAGWKTFVLATYADRDKSTQFAQQNGLDFPFYIGDDKLLKTIIRANPGIVVWKDGRIVTKKYHSKHIPSFDQIKQ